MNSVCFQFLTARASTSRKSRSVLVHAGRLSLSVEDDQLLTEQRVLSDEVFPGAGQILQGSHEEGATRWPRPLQYTLLDPPERALESALERSEHSSHSSIGSFKKRGEVRDTGERALMHGFYFDDILKIVTQARRI